MHSVGGMLIAATELKQHLGDPEWVVFDCRHDLSDFEKGARLYGAGHVPGAYFASVESVLAGKKTGANGRHPLPRAEDLAEFFNRHGVTAATQIVAYDDVGGQYAARLWWLARWIGLTRVAVLDGGLLKWLAEGGAVTTEISAPRGGGTVVARPNANRAIEVAAVLTGVESGGRLVIDARAPERFRGEVEPIDRIAGHIPTARNRFFKLNLNADLTMRPAAELRREFEAVLGGRKADEVVHQCGSGITACVNLLAMEHAGLAGSKLYVGSWSEWIADPARAVARGGVE
jgi:thiosulfate/3-mercaptopyruvate sulfurtransferase